MNKSRRLSPSLFWVAGAICLALALSFLLYQHKRERDYRIDVMHSRLQMYNYEMVHTLSDSLLSPTAFRDYVAKHNFEDLRVTLINMNGEVLLDSYQDATSMDNHLERVEIQQALREGEGYDIKRVSASTSGEFFYSATQVDSLIVRVAIPYSTQITHSLQADNTYFYYAVLLVLLIGFITHTLMGYYFRMRTAEQEQERIKRQLTQNAAHELKTPAASIQGYLESILLHPEMDEEKKQHFLERCYAQSTRMSNLLTDMATLTKLDESPSRLQDTELVDVKAVIRNALDDTALQLKELGITPIVELPPQVHVQGETSLFYSLFRNLIDNVIVYATGATWLNISCRQEGHHFHFSVSDNGPGVAPEHLNRLFERFYRVDKGRSRKMGGTGLGLAIVKNAVASMGGDIVAKPTEGGGLTIEFTI
ncbi:MAG: histidine kinase [Bacteroidaceae bacterium]|nr:histidine kinase [Bacteroidaceae bacterium]